MSWKLQGATSWTIPAFREGEGSNLVYFGSLFAAFGEAFGDLESAWGSNLESSVYHLAIFGINVCLEKRVWI